MFNKTKIISILLVLLSAIVLSANANASSSKRGPNCDALPSHSELTSVLKSVVSPLDNGGLGNDMWGTVVNRDGVVCAVFRTGNKRGDQWPGSRVISAQKASTANSFSLENDYPNAAGVGRALSTGNLYGLVQPGGSLFGLQFSNPVDPSIAYGFDGSPGNAESQAARRYGNNNDPMVGDIPGGVNVFGGGLGLYNSNGDLVGAIGVSGDTSCADHVIAWKVRDAIGLDNIPGGIGFDGTDNLNIANPVTPNTFEHPTCGFGEDPIIQNLNTTHPIGS